ncbi:MAG: phosphoribosylanthranilate isomerase [Candidatus Acidiferrales bacterium]
MRRVKVKICGITNWTDARRAVEAGAHFLGFNFYRQSPRYIQPAAARRIVRRLPERVSAVGVFVNETEESILAIAGKVGLDYLQLHGEESPELVARLKHKFPVIKAIRVRESFRLSHLDAFHRASAFLLDGFDSRRHGGTGKTFNWNLARRSNGARRIFLAGGLTPENVAEAIHTAHPYAVDVCSGVEARPGRKDPMRILALMWAVKAAQGEAK